MTRTAARNLQQSPSGLLIVDKHAGITSHGVVARCRRLLGTRKVGHAGTLDPMATGVLVLGIGRGTKLLGYISGGSKTYAAEVRLGIGTITEDAEGEVTAAPGCPPLSEQQIAEVLGKFIGEIQQVPSAVSAIKIEGERAYSLVRRGETPKMNARPVSIYALDLIGKPQSTVTEEGLPVVDLSLRVDCSSGTYVRALARDLGAALGTAAHLTSLRRERVSSWTLGEAITIEQMEQAVAADKAVPLLSLDSVTHQMFPVVEVGDEVSSAFRNGRPIEQTEVMKTQRDSRSGDETTQPEQLVAVVASSDPSVTLGLAQLKDGKFRSQLQLLIADQ